MKSLNKDARGFVDGVIKYIKTDGKSETANSKVRFMLSKVSELDKSQNAASIETAVELTANEKTAFINAVGKIAGHAVGVLWVVKPELLGGYRLTIGDYIIDDSLVNQLTQLQSVLL